MKRGAVAKKPNEPYAYHTPPSVSKINNLTSSTSASTSKINQAVYRGELVRNQNQITSVAPSGKKPIDGHYYLNQVDETSRRLDKLCMPYQIYIDSPTMLSNDDALEQIRTTVGKARLLKNQKLEQFRSLCHKNLNSDVDQGEFTTRLNDLAGFWDMVSIQVEETYAAFEKLELLKSNHWRVDNAGSRVGSSSVKINMDMQKLNTMDLTDRIKAREEAAKKRNDEAKAKKSAGLSRTTWN